MLQDELPFFNHSGITQRCRYIDNDLELWYDESQQLDYVRLKPRGILAISQNYQRKYYPYFQRNGVLQDRILTLNVGGYVNHSNSSLAQNIFTKNREFLDYLHVSFSQIEKNQSVILQVPFVNEYGDIMHVYPFILAKDSHGQSIIIDFDRVFEGRQEFQGVKIITIQNYKQFGYDDSGNPILNQNDYHSCSVFAVDVLKNCAIDPYFMQQIYSGSANRTIMLDAMQLGQNSATINSFTDEKIFTYAHNNSVNKLQNQKAFFKGHEYARILGKQDDLQDYLSSKSQQLLGKINQERNYYRSSALNSQIVDNYELYRPHTSFKALDAIAPNQGNYNIWHKEKQLHPENFRGNNFKVLQGVYPTQQRIHEAMLDILILSAVQAGIDLKEAKEAIVIAKRDGGVAHALNLEPQQNEGNYRMNDNPYLSGYKLASSYFRKLKTFSAKFQKNCEACGIYSGRQGSDRGLRLTFLPDNVLKDFARIDQERFTNVSEAQENVERIKDVISSINDDQIQR